VFSFRVALSVASFLRSPQRQRLKLCANPGCGFAFVDTSINATRRWRFMRQPPLGPRLPGPPENRSPGAMTSLSRMRIVAPGAERDRYLPLFYVADDSTAQIQESYQQGDLYALDDAAGEPGAIVLAIALPGGEVELKTVAVAPPLQRQGVGREFLAAVLQRLRQRGTRRVLVGTSTSNIGALAFYQHAGFRMWRVERDFFTPARGYPIGLEENGIPVRDTLWLDQDLSGQP